MSRCRKPLHARRGEQDGANEREPAPRHLVSVAFANASGRRSRSTQRRSVFGPTAITWRSSPNSASSWRHAPHGDAGGATPRGTTMRLNPPAPSAIAGPIAIRSAQIVRRSGERRVGEEGRYRWGPRSYKKKKKKSNT